VIKEGDLNDIRYSSVKGLRRLDFSYKGEPLCAQISGGRRDLMEYALKELNKRESK